MSRAGAATASGLLTFGHADPLYVPPRQGRVGLVGVLLQMRDVAVARRVHASGRQPDSLGDALSRTRRHVTGALARRDRQRPARPARLGRRPARAVRAPGRHRLRDPRPRRGGACPTSARSSWSIPRAAATCASTRAAAACASATPRPPPRSASSWRRTSARPARTTSCSRPTTTGCGRSCSASPTGRSLR